MADSLIPLLILTTDDLLWSRWSQAVAHRWLPARGRGLPDAVRWAAQQRQLVLLDAELPRLPAWPDPAWGQVLPAVRLVVASSRPDDERGSQALSAGASGYCHAYMPPSALGTVLDVVASGGVWMGRSLVSRLLQGVHARLPDTGTEWAAGLTGRERSVARRAAMGESNQQIADALSITERTVRAHLSAVFDKLDVGDRLQLALRVHGITAGVAC